MTGYGRLGQGEIIDDIPTDAFLPPGEHAQDFQPGRVCQRLGLLGKTAKIGIEQLCFASHGTSECVDFNYIIYYRRYTIKFQGRPYFVGEAVSVNGSYESAQIMETTGRIGNV